jgi:LPS-assembly lipoprotein
MKNFILALALLMVTACGFEPMYGRNINEHTGVENELARVDIGNIPDREGQYLRNALIDRFYRNGRPVNPAYTLDIDRITETLVDLDITKSSDATRGQLKVQTRMKLVNRATGKIALERELRSITSYNILGSEFATRVTEDNARTNALDDLARQAEMQLNLYFKRN